MVAEGEETKMVFLGAVRNVSTNNILLLFLFTPKPIATWDVKDVTNYIYCCNVKEFCEVFVSTWLAENIYEGKGNTYMRECIDSNVS